MGKVAPSVSLLNKERKVEYCSIKSVTSYVTYKLFYFLFQFTLPPFMHFFYFHFLFEVDLASLPLWINEHYLSFTRYVIVQEYHNQKEPTIVLPFPFQMILDLSFIARKKCFHLLLESYQFFFPGNKFSLA